MPDMPKLREIISTFTPEELELSVPIYVQDITLTDLPIVNEYNRLLSIKDYQGAYNYRIKYKELEKYIIDAKKINILITYIMNAYEFSKMEKNAANTSYDNSKSNLPAKNVQDAIDKLPRIPQDMGIAAITAYGSGYTYLTDGVITEIPLSKTIADSETISDYYLVEENGIGIYEPGWYLISASAYMRSDKKDGRVARTVFVVDEKNNEILSSTENIYSHNTETYGAIATATKLIKVTWDDLNIPYNRYKLSLHVRSKGASGRVDNNNNSTFLTIVRIGHYR